MAITYVNDLRLSEMGTGDNSGTWGTVTNTNLELIGEAFGFGTEAITTNADTHTSTIADGATDPVRAMYVKYTGTLDSTCTITIGPNTVNKFYYIENGTSGSQDIVISQGSGANVTIPAGDVKAVYLDGAGSGAAVVDAFASLSVGALTATTADNTAQLTLISTDADANAGPKLKLRRNSASPADDDLIGAIDWTSENSDGDEHDFLNLTARMRDVTAGSEDVAYAWSAYLNGTAREIQSFVNTDASAASMVFNEDSQDIDFRVESNNHDNLFFIDGGNDGIGIGNSTIIDWSTNYPGLQMGQAGALYGHKSSNQMTFGMNWGVTTGNVYIADGIASRMVMDTSKISFDTSASGSAAGSITGINTLQMTSSGSVFNEDSADLDFRVESDARANMFYIDGGVSQVGVGMVPDQSWGSNSVGINFGVADADAGWIGWHQISGGDNFHMMWNVYHDNSNFRYASNNPAAKYTQNSTSHTFSHAVNGSADAVISFIENLRMNSTGAAFNEAGADLDFRVESDGNANMLFVDAGNDHVNIGIGTDRGGVLNVYGTGTPIAVIESEADGTVLSLRSTDTDANAGPSLELYRNATGAASDNLGSIIVKGTDASAQDQIYFSIGTQISAAGNGAEASTVFFQNAVAGTVRERITMSSSALVINQEGLDNDFRVESDDNANMLLVDASNSVVCVGTSDTSVAGNTGSARGVNINHGYIEAAMYQDVVMYLNRMNNDGVILDFKQDGSTEGTVSVSGSTVSYNGFAGRHESSGIPTTTARGTVVSTIDELDVYLSGNKQGQTRADHAKVEVSNSVGDPCVYGVVDDFTDDGSVNVTSVGIAPVRVTGSCAKGDLLESNGDGTAKVQSDDIIRSKTIGKVTIGNSDTGVKLVSCVMYCG